MYGREGIEKEDTINEYKWWLVDLVGGDQYLKLLKELYNTEFVWSVDYDENRAKDGIDLRYIFYTEKGIPYDESMSDWPCSVLEMMIGLSIAIENYIMYDPKYGDRTPNWFWIMSENLGIIFSDRDFNGTKKRSNAMKVDIKLRVDKMLNRKYSYSGQGSMFPIEDPAKDMRTLELWDQANIYAMKTLM